MLPAFGDRSARGALPFFVMPALVAGIHVDAATTVVLDDALLSAAVFIPHAQLSARADVDRRDKPGDDE